MFDFKALLKALIPHTDADIKGVLGIIVLLVGLSMFVLLIVGSTVGIAFLGYNYLVPYLPQALVAWFNKYIVWIVGAIWLYWIVGQPLLETVVKRYNRFKS